MARNTLREATAILLRGERRELNQLLKALPAGVDPHLVARAAIRYLGSDTWSFVRAARRLPAAVVQAIVELLPAHPSVVATFLLAYLPGHADLAAAWERALSALLDFDLTWPWASKQRRDRLVALAEDPEVVAAIQATVVSWPNVRPDLLAVLTIEASDASLDALMPHFERAAKDPGTGLDRLDLLRTHATRTANMEQMFKRVDALVAARHASSPAVELARKIGFEGLVHFWFRADLISFRSGLNPIGTFHASLSVNSKPPAERDWFAADLTDNRREPTAATWIRGTTLTRDDLGLGGCAPERLPAWLAATARKLNFEWDFDGVELHTHLLGHKRRRLTEWLKAAAS